MRLRTSWRVGALLIGLTLALAGCGGGSTASGLSSTSGTTGSTSGTSGSTGGTSGSGTTKVTGVAMPSSVSVVTATNAH